MMFDKWIGICRIVQHSVVNGVETSEQIAVRHLIDCQCRLDDVQFCFWHCCVLLSFGFRETSLEAVRIS